MITTKALLPAVSAILAATLVGCGSSDDTTGSGAGGPLASTEIDGAGTVFTDGEGRAVYVAEEEKSGEVLCVDACLGVWDPVTATDADAEGDFGTLTRPDDSSTQLTWQGAPVYTFKLEEAGEVTGELTDDFGGTSFTWQVVRADDSAPPAGEESSTPPDMGGYY